MSRQAAIAVEGQTKLCKRCGRTLPLSQFNRGRGKYGVASRCKECEHEIHNDPTFKARRLAIRDLRRKSDPTYKEREKLRHIATLLSSEISYKKYLLRGARQRALNNNIPFDISIEDFDIPEYCPLLGVKLNKHLGEGHRNINNCWDSPSLDRIVPELGYTKGNVWVVSLRANTLKNNASIEELEALVSNLRRKMNSRN